MPFDATTPLPELLTALRPSSLSTPERVNAREQAAAELLRRLNRLAQRAHKRYEPKQVTPDEVAAEALDEVLRYSDKVSAAEKPEHYLATIVRRTLGRLARLEERFAHVPLPPADTVPNPRPESFAMPESPPPDERLQRILDRAIAQLRPKDQDLLRAKFEGRSIQALADEHNVPYGTMAVRLHRASVRLARKLGLDPDQPHGREFLVLFAKWLRKHHP